MHGINTPINILNNVIVTFTKICDPEYGTIISYDLQSRVKCLEIYSTLCTAIKVNS